MEPVLLAGCRNLASVAVASEEGDAAAGVAYEGGGFVVGFSEVGFCDRGGGER